MKTFPYITGILYLMMLFSACSNEELQFTQAEPNLNESELVVKLENLNDSILTLSSARTRGGLSWQTCAIAIADIRGAWSGAKAGAYLGAKIGSFLGSPHTGAVTFGIIGGCALGAFDSYVTYKGLKGTRAVSVDSLDYATVASVCANTISDDLTVTNQSITCTSEDKQKLEVDSCVTVSVSLEEQYLNVGKMHNIILGVADGLVEIKQDVCINNQVVTSVLESVEFQQMYNDLTYKILNNIEDEGDSLEERVINLFCEVFQQYSTNCDDVAFIINKYIEILRDTNELTETQLNSIKIGLATSLYSFNYWDKTLEANEK